MKLLTAEFVKLQAEWYERLKHDGFADIEDRRGNLKQYDRRTIAFDHRDSIREFFITLDHYLTSHPDIPERHRHILVLYSQGRRIKDISKYVARHRWTVMETIKKYKAIILKEMDLTLNEFDN